MMAELAVGDLVISRKVTMEHTKVIDLVGKKFVIGTDGTAILKGKKPVDTTSGTRRSGCSAKDAAMAFQGL